MKLAGQLLEAVAAGGLREVDAHFALTLAELDERAGPALLLAAALVSRETGQGHVCVELRRFAGRPLFGADPALTAPGLEDWLETLQGCGAIGAPGEDRPLILDQRGRLYLGRYWYFESTIGRRLRELAGKGVTLSDTAYLRERLAHYFPERDEGPDRQKLAAAAALLNRVTVVSGGPGTGKTSTVTRLLALLVEAGKTAPRIVLAAPTGKAAARLAESIELARDRLDLEPAVCEAIGTGATTIHRLLGWIPGQSGFRHHARNPLHLDVLVVDEASMIDVPLMARLLDALPEHARLILLGDKDQLASVEAGSVLGDICNRGAAAALSPAFRGRLSALGVEAPLAGDATDSPLADSLVVLTRSYRFGADSGIGNLARAVNRDDAAGALDVCAAPDFPDASWSDVTAAGLPHRVAESAVGAYGDYLRADDPADALAALGRFRFLCALRSGPQGVAEVNRIAEGALQRAGLIRAGELHYPGRPIMIARNDYGMRLFNGDVGVIWPDPASDNRLRAFFPDGEGGLRRVLPSRLPAHDTVYAMTVHKSQGSEFDRCVVILPEEDAPVVTRELIYTAVTRAKETVALWGEPNVFRRFVNRRVTRASGLREALWGTPSTDGSR